MQTRAFYRKDWELELDQGATDVTEYLADIDAFERKVDDALMFGRAIFFQTMKITFIYHGEFKDIIDNADENDVHVIFIAAKPPESGNWKTVIHGAIDLRSVTIDESERLVSFDLLDKLAYTSMFAFPNYRETVNIYDAFDLDYSAGDRLKMLQTGEGVMFYRTDASGNYDDLNSGGIQAGSVIEYENNGYTKRLFILSIEEATVEDQNEITWDSYYAKTYGVKAKNNDYPVGTCDENGGCYEFPEDFKAYSPLVYGKDVYVKDANGEITDIDGAKLIEAVLLQVDTNASVINNIDSPRELGVKDWYSLTFELPDNMKDQLKKLAEKSNVSLFVNKDFNYVIQKRFCYLTGTERTYEDWHAKKGEVKRSAFDIVRRYKCTVDGNDGVVVKTNVDNQWFNWGIVEELELNYNGVTQDEATLKSFAQTWAGYNLSFYGKRRAGYELELALLKDSYLDWELYDNIGGTTNGYFIISIKYDFIKSKMTVELVEINGHTPATQ